MVLSHAELANVVGTSRETVTRLLNELERKRFIARDDTNVTILQFAKLEKLAH
jgi:CRP/FNR family cyclic AMP-dependent transcriptional regulator